MGKHLHELLGWPGPMTHRQFRAWQDFLQEQGRTPRLTDFYLMQVAHESRYAFAEKKRDFSSKEYELEFKDAADNNKPKELSSEEFTLRVAELKCRFAGGMKVSPRELGVDPNIFARKK